MKLFPDGMPANAGCIGGNAGRSVGERHDIWWVAARR
jgi:hypothetical protein